MKLVRTICLCFVLVFTAVGAGSRPAIAQSLATHPAASPTGGAPYWLVLPAKNGNRLTLRTRDQVGRYADTFFSMQAQPVLSQLEALQSAGLVSNVALAPLEHAISLQIDSPAALKKVQALAGGGSLLEQTGANSACAQKFAQAFNQQVQALSQRSEQAQNISGATIINVYAPYQFEWSDVEGSTTPNTTVSLRILRGASVIWTETSASDALGEFYFSPDWIGSCTATPGYSWKLVPGDVVEITANVKKVSTVVAKISAWVDPVKNIVGGETDSNRTVKVDLVSPAANACETQAQHTILTQAARSGKFSIDFSKKVDFNRRATANIYSQDANGNSTYTDPYAFSLYIEGDSAYSTGTLRPLTPFTGALQRGSAVLANVSGETNSYGDFYLDFTASGTQTYQSGDVISASDGTNHVSLTYAAVAANLNAETDQLTGTIKPGWTVFASVHSNSAGSFVTGCGDEASGCKAAAADSSGNFGISLTGSYDVQRGDPFELEAYNSEGYGEQSSGFSSPVLSADLSRNVISGFWMVAPDAGMTMTLEKADHSQKEDVPVQSFQNINYFWGVPQVVSIAPGDSITVTDGSHTESMTVGTLSGVFNPSTKHLTGAVSNGYLIAHMEDFDRQQEYTDRCETAAPYSGSYDFDFSAAAVVGPQDTVYLSSISATDHQITLREARGAGINLNFGPYLSVNGYTPAPGDSYTLEVQQPDGTVVEKSPVMTSMPEDGYFQWVPAQPILTGQKVVLKDSLDTITAQVSMPALTMNFDPSTLIVSGTAPESGPVMMRLYQETWNWPDSLEALLTDVDASGNYSLTFHGIDSDCSAVTQKSCLYTSLDYFDLQENEIVIDSAAPAPVSKDSFEPDDSLVTAHAFVSGEVHTFDTSTDIDWVSLTFDESQVGKPYTLKAVNPVPGDSVFFTVYGADQATVVDSESTYAFGSSRITFTPTDTGPYYLQVAPSSSQFTGKCGSSYLLSVNHDYFLPLVGNGTPTASPYSF